MSADRLTLKSFFCADPATPIADSCDMRAARKAVDLAAVGLPPLTRKNLFKAVAGALDEFFQVNLDDILESAWDRVAALRDIKAASRAEPGKVIPFPMLDHKVSSVQQPHLDLTLAGQSLSRLHFETALSLKLSGVHLAVGGGRIHGLTSGLCNGEASFSLGGVTLLERATPRLSLPGRLRFGGGGGAHE